MTVFPSIYHQIRANNTSILIFFLFFFCKREINFHTFLRQTLCKNYFLKCNILGKNELRLLSNTRRVKYYKIE